MEKKKEEDQFFSFLPTRSERYSNRKKKKRSKLISFQALQRINLTHRGGHAGRGGRAHDDDAILIVIIGGNRGHGGVIGEPMGLVSVIGSSIGIGVTGSDVTAEGSLPDHQNAASRLQHDHLPHPRHPLLSLSCLLLTKKENVHRLHESFLENDPPSSADPSIRRGNAFVLQPSPPLGS